jgi:hypothetical protein
VADCDSEMSGIQDMGETLHPLLLLLLRQRRRCFNDEVYLGKRSPRDDLSHHEIEPIQSDTKIGVDTGNPHLLTIMDTMTHHLGLYVMCMWI